MGDKSFNKNKNLSQKKEIVQEIYTYSGPLPHPNLLNQYDQKTRANIVKIALKQSSHRQSIESQIIKSSTRNEFCGMIFSFLLTALMMSVGGFLVFHNKSIVGFLTIFAPAVFQAKNYYDQKKKEQELA